MKDLLKNKKFMVVVIAGLAIYVIFSLTPSFIKDFSRGRQEAVVGNFKKGFLESCQENNKSAERAKLCNCIVDQMISQLTYQQLVDEEFARNYMNEKIIPVCQKGIVSQK